MSGLASELSARREALRPTRTLVTLPDGTTRAEEKLPDGKLLVTLVSASGYGFVVDTKPDLRYSFILNQLLVGSQDVAHDLDILTKNKITHILNVASGIPNLFEGWFIYKNIEVYDTPSFNLIPILDECVQFIHATIVAGGCVLVHCNAGISRSVSMVIAYLIKHCGMNYEESYEFVKSKRTFIRPNSGFVEQLKAYEKNH